MGTWIKKATAMRPVACAIAAAALLLGATGCREAEAPTDTRPLGTPTPIERAIAEPGREALESTPTPAATDAPPTTGENPAATPAATDTPTTETIVNTATPERPFAVSLVGSLPRPAFMGDTLTTEGIERHAGEPGVVGINWKFDSEENTFGFYVLRGNSIDGPLERINADLPIAGAGNSSSARYYAYYDLNVKVGEVYYYGLEEITLDGEVNRIEKTDPPFAIKVQALRMDEGTTASTGGN